MRIDRSLALHGALAGAATLAAYVAWVNPRFTRDDASIEIIAGRPEALDEVTWQDATNEVTVRRDGAEIRVLIATRKEGAGAAKTFPAAAAARELFGHMAPLTAVRKLGQADDAHVKAFGLAEPQATLRLRYGNVTHTLRIGTATFGSGHSYVQSEDGDVFLVKASQLGDLKSGASVLAERALFAFARDKVERLVLTTPVKTRELVQRFREDAARAFWADPAEPNGRLAQAGNWVDRLLRARVSDLAAHKPSGPPALSVEGFGDGHTLGQVAIWTPSDGDALATSSTFATAVVLPRWAAEGLLKELDAVLAERP